MWNKNNILIVTVVFLAGLGIFLTGLNFTSDREELLIESHEADDRNLDLRKQKMVYCSKIESQLSQGLRTLSENEIVKIHVLCPSLAEMYITKE